MSVEGVFVRGGERWRATELGRGPWDPEALHGGAPAALLVHAFEAVQPEIPLARLTYEFVRPVPLAELTVAVDVVRPGRRVALLEGTICGPAGEVVTRARALKVQVSEDGAPDRQPPPFPGPEDGASNDFAILGQPTHTMFATDAMEIRFVEGSFRNLGPATAWFRLRHPLVAGEEPSPFERAAAAGDFGNGISSVLSWEEHVFINPDLTIYLEREPRGEWVAMQSRTRVHHGGISVSESTIWDEQGRIGHAMQALLVGRR